MASIALLEPYEHTTVAQERADHRSVLIRALIMSALKKIDQSAQALAHERPVEAGFYIGRATSIVDALRDALDLEQGGQVARDFDSIYDHVDTCLQVAVGDAAPEALAKAREAVCQLSALWQADQYSDALGAGTA
jgi:flagellar protein FliS